MRARIPPPAIYLLAFLVALWLEAAVYRVWLVDAVRTPAWLIAAGAVLVVAGVGTALSGVLTFRRAGTTILPYRQASRLVVHGPYRFTRNPMYLGVTVAYVGGALVLNSGWPLLLLPVVIAVMYLVVIRGEEARMRETFGAEYDEYRARVRRWI